MSYADDRKALLEDLMGQVNLLLAAGTKEQAWDVMQDVMKYQLISKQEGLDIIKKKFKLKKDTDLISRYDYRRDSAMFGCPANIYYDFPWSTNITVLSKGHWITRRELQYVGEQERPDLNLKYTILKAEAGLSAVKTAAEIYKDQRAKELDKEIAKRVREGQDVVYKIVLDSSTAYTLRTLGTIICETSSKDKGITIRYYLDIKGMKNSHMDVIDTHGLIVNAFNKMLVENGITADRIKESFDMIEYKKVGEKQRETQVGLTPIRVRMHELNEAELSREAEDLAFRYKITIDEAKEKILNERAEAERKKAEKKALAEQRKAEKAKKARERAAKKAEKEKTTEQNTETNGDK